MLIDVEKIKVTDRIRKDFGNIQELADDIKANGLINPPVVTPENDGSFTLLTGERRLRAMQSLGYKQIEVRTWSSLSDEQKLNIEISENEVRKDFSKAERIEYARRLEKVESLKAKERQGNRTDLTSAKNFAEVAKTSDIVANEVGIGSGRQYEKEKYIVDNQSQLTPEDFADWDEGKLSTNKAYQKIKKQLEEKDNQIAGYELKLKRISELTAQIEALQKELDERPQVEVEVKPKDYDTIVRLKNESEKDNQRLRENYESKCKELSELKAQVKTEKEQRVQSKAEKKIIDDAIFFCGKIDSFIKDVGGLAYLSDRLEQLPDNEKKSYVKAVSIIKAWADNILANIE